MWVPVMSSRISDVVCGLNGNARRAINADDREVVILNGDGAGGL